MFTRRLTALTTFFATVVLVGCSPGEVPPVPVNVEQVSSLNDVREDSDVMVEEIMAEFSDAALVPDANQARVYECTGEDAGVGHWITASAFTSTDVQGGIDALREKFANIESSYGTAPQDIEYADGSPWSVSTRHLLLEDESGSYLLSFAADESGTVITRVITTCGELR